jgi:ubiquinone/menaquinone biosynthesis C-methylase UbiE
MLEPLRLYARQEHVAPGAARTVELIADWARLDEGALVIDLATAKGEAACTLAGRFACRVLALETYDPFVNYAAAKAWHWNLRDLVTVVRGHGSRLPLPDASCDVAFCLGAPSVPALENCLAEMARVLRPGGCLFLSNATRRVRRGGAVPPDDDAPEAAGPRLSASEHVTLMADHRLAVLEVLFHRRDAWEERWRPMLQVAEEAKLDQPADPDFAFEVETMVEAERRAADGYLDYVTFWARRPER